MANVTPEALKSFLDDLNAVCKQHGLKLSYTKDEDDNVTLAVTDHSDWLMDAEIEWRERDCLYEPCGACERFEGEKKDFCVRCGWHTSQHKGGTTA